MYVGVGVFFPHFDLNKDDSTSTKVYLTMF